MFQEEKRQAVHILLFVFAFFLKYLVRWQAVLLLAFFLLITLTWVPRSRVRGYLYRHLENKYSAGGVLYFLTLLILVLIFPPYVVAASWAILAWGDGAATLVGQNFKARELPWNRRKTYAGSFAFLLFGTLGAFILLKWMLPDLAGQAALTLGFKAALAAAVVESLPLRLNDNVSVAVVSALTLNFLI